jgi:hypothetical protein
MDATTVLCHYPHMFQGDITVRKPVEAYGSQWPYEVWVDGQRVGTIGRTETFATFRIGAGAHVVSVTSSRVMTSEPVQVDVPPGARVEVTVHRRAGAGMSRLAMAVAFVALLLTTVASRWATEQVLGDHAGPVAYLGMSLLVAFALLAIFLGLTRVVAPRYWVWWSLSADNRA